jgi:hypothetical protein
VLGSALYHALSHLNQGPHCIGLAPNHQNWPAVAATVVSTTLKEPDTQSQRVLIEQGRQRKPRSNSSNCGFRSTATVVCVSRAKMTRP